MEYTLFFSYQSDTKYEYKFIKNILINDVTKALKNDGIELVVNYGMRETAGNSNLLETMLKKGEECDIFLADLTYVTSFTNYKGEIKFVPNPNVMLELGHAWNYHGDNHIIFIQNKACGVSEDLPVDLRGFRFPISYTLNDDNGMIDKDKKELISDLSAAIISVVKSIKNENKVRFLPFEEFEYSQLQYTNSQYEFIVTDTYNEIVNQLSNTLSSGRIVILSGKSGSGKSRIIKEFICSKFLNQQRNDIYYCNFLQTDIAALCDEIKKIKNCLSRKSYFIVDNCNKQCFEQLSRIWSGTDHKLIIITNESDIHNSVKINHEKYINEIISTKAPDNWYEYQKLHITDVGHILAVLNNDFQYIPKKYNLGDGCQNCENLLGYLSLFSKVGFCDNLRDEFFQMCTLFDLDEKDSRNKINNLIRKGFVYNQGDFIFIESDAVAREYAKDMWKQKIIQDSLFNSLTDKYNLSLSFIKRQIQIASDSDACSMFLKKIIQENIRNIDFISTYQGQNILYQLAQKFPEDTLKSLKILIYTNKDFPSHIIDTYLCAFQVIIKQEGFFDQIIQLLLYLCSNAINNSARIKNTIINEFLPNNINYNKHATAKSFEKIYSSKHIDIIKTVYSSIFNLGYKSLSEQLIQYLKDMFLFLISIRTNNKEWANIVIIDNIHASKYLKISHKVNSQIRNIIKENDDEQNANIAKILAKKLRWSSLENEKTITKLLKLISDKNSRMTLYSKVVLNKIDSLTDRETIKSEMSNIADEILSIKNWENDIDILLTGGRKWDSNCFWFGYSMSQKYNKCDELISRCLDLYKSIPSENQSYGFFNGLANIYVSKDDYSVLKQKRNELLKNPTYFNLAMSLSNTLENTFEDLMSIKTSIITNSRSLVLINELYFVNLSEKEYCAFASQLINISRDGADSAIKLLDRARNIYTNINISDCVVEIIGRYKYWDVSDIKYDSVYSKHISLLEYVLKTNPSQKLAEKIIEYIIDGADNINFNVNCSVVNLFIILIENYQELFLKKILPIINDESFDSDRKIRHLADIFSFKNSANADVYIDWCNKNGDYAAKFVSKFVIVFLEDADGNCQWTREVKALMNNFCHNKYVLDNISTRLFNGEVSIQKYQKLKNAYDLLTTDTKDEIKIWAILQSRFMESNIQRLKKQQDRMQIWDR